MKFLLIILTTFSINSIAQDLGVEIDYLPYLSNEEYMNSGAKLHKAEGLHQCQSSESIGHTCRNLGVNYTDCNQAFYSLKREDCCSGSKYGGSSISFKIIKCSTIY